MVTSLLPLLTSWPQKRVWDSVTAQAVLQLKLWILLTYTVCWVRHKLLALAEEYLVRNVLEGIVVDGFCMCVCVCVCGVNYSSLCVWFSVLCSSLVLVQKAFRVFSEWEKEHKRIRKTTTGSASARGLSTALLAWWSSLILPKQNIKTEAKAHIVSDSFLQNDIILPASLLLSVALIPAIPAMSFIYLKHARFNKWKFK